MLMWSNDPLKVTWERDNCTVKVKIRILLKKKKLKTDQIIKANRGNFCGRKTEVMQLSLLSVRTNNRGPQLHIAHNIYHYDI